MTQSSPTEKQVGRDLEQIANNLLITAFGSLENIPVPVRIGQVATASGLSVKAGDFAHPDISGVYSRLERTIYVDLDDTPLRQAFTIAHGLGHHFCTPEVTEEIIWRYSANRINAEQDKGEHAANILAAHLLLPRQVLSNYQTHKTTPRALARRFSVTQAMLHFQQATHNLVQHTSITPASSIAPLPSGVLPAETIEYADFVDQLRSAYGHSDQAVDLIHTRELLQKKTLANLTAKNQQKTQPDYGNYFLWFIIGALVAILGMRLIRL